MDKNTAEYRYYQQEMDKFVCLLNEGRYYVIRIDDTVRDELRTLVDEWLTAKANGSRFVERRLASGKKVPFNSGTFRIQWQPIPIMVPLGAPECTEAEGFFQHFILNKLYQQLAGPCRRRGCGRYFLRRTAHPKVYCTARCASMDTAVKAMKEGRKERHKILIQAAKVAVDQWKRRRIKRDWKVWVVDRIGEITGIDINTRSLTEWVRDGKLRAP